MKNKNILIKDDASSFTFTNTESRSMLLGEEAGTNRLDLYYENQKNLLKVHFEQQKKQQERMKSVKKEPIKSTYLPKTAPARLEKQSEKPKPNLLKEVSNLKLSTVRNSSIRFSAREKTIMDWAFKRFEVETLAPKTPKKRKKTRFDHEFWFEDDRDIAKGAIFNKDIILDDENELENNFDFYRTQRKAATTKTDIEINRQSKQLETKLIELSKERFKVLNVLDYEKKKFVRHQLLKSESLPGLRCVALVNENPHYKFKRPGKVTSFEKVHQINSTDSEKNLINLPDINATITEITSGESSQPQTVLEAPKHKVKVEPLSDDKKLQRFNTTNTLIDSTSQYKENKTELAKIEFNRSKTDNQIKLNSISTSVSNTINNNNLLLDDLTRTKTELPLVKQETAKTSGSDKTKLKQSKSNETEKSSKQQQIENESNLQDSSKSDISDMKSKSQTNMTHQEESTKVKSILKQPSTIKSADQRTIVFDEKSTNNRVKSAKSTKSAKSRANNNSEESQFTSIDIMLGVFDKTDDLEDVESQNSTASFNIADTVITNDAVTFINDQTLAANIKLVNDYMELEEESLEMVPIQQHENVDELMESFMKARAKNVSSLSEPYPKLGEDNEDVQAAPRSSDDSSINLKSTKETNHKVSFKLTSETNERSTHKLNDVKQDGVNEIEIQQAIIKPIEKGQKITLLNRRPKLTNNLTKKLAKSVNLLDGNLVDGNTSSFHKLEQFLEPINVSYTNIQAFISPIQDNRFTDFISVVKPAYISKETKDVRNIIEKNDALKSINIDTETREKMNKVKERGSKLAVKARQILASGEYSREFIQ